MVSVEFAAVVHDFERLLSQRLQETGVYICQDLADCRCTSNFSIVDAEPLGEGHKLFFGYGEIQERAENRKLALNRENPRLSAVGITNLERLWLKLKPALVEYGPSRYFRMKIREFSSSSSITSAWHNVVRELWVCGTATGVKPRLASSKRERPTRPTLRRYQKFGRT